MITKVIEKRGVITKKFKALARKALFWRALLQIQADRYNTALKWIDNEIRMILEIQFPLIVGLDAHELVFACRLLYSLLGRYDGE